MFYYEKRDDINRDWFAVEEAVDFSYPQHLHRWYEIIIITDGKMDVSVDGTVYTLCKNDSLFIFPNQIHSLTSVSSSHHKLILIKPELIAHFNAKMQNKIPSRPKKHIENAAWLQLWGSVGNTASIEEMKGLLYYYCSFFTESDFRDADGSELPDSRDLMHRIFRFAADNFTESCLLSNLAAAIGYDYSYLSKLFSEKIGISYTEYVNMLRIDRACYLLKNTDRPIIDIAADCGYGSLRTFNRNFSRIVGMTPREYKKSPLGYKYAEF